MRSSILFYLRVFTLLNPFSMKTKLLLIATAFILTIMMAQAQAPAQMNYQAIVRNSAGQPVGTGTPVKLRFIIHDSVATGPMVYTEVIDPTANQFGLVNTQIGSTANLGSVAWGRNAKFLEVDVDISNTGTFINMGTTQLVSAFRMRSSPVVVPPDLRGLQEHRE
jgi:hypothetical protein